MAFYKRLLVKATLLPTDVPELVFFVKNTSLHGLA